MKKVLIDTNIILDIVLNREKFYENSVNVIKYLSSNSFEIHISSTTVTDIYYIVKKEKGHVAAIDFLQSILKFISIAGVNQETVELAMVSKIKDFEDAVQESTCVLSSLDAIITRNKKDFKNSKINIFTPYEFLLDSTQ